MSNVRARAFESVSRLEALGTKESLAKAAKIEKNVQNMLSQVKSIKIQDEGAQGVSPEAGGQRRPSAKSKDEDIGAWLRSKGMRSDTKTISIIKERLKRAN